jgi:hypothetical protein
MGSSNLSPENCSDLSGGRSAGDHERLTDRPAIDPPRAYSRRDEGLSNFMAGGNCDSSMISDRFHDSLLGGPKSLSEAVLRPKCRIFAIAAFPNLKLNEFETVLSFLSCNSNRLFYEQLSGFSVVGTGCRVTVLERNH